MSNGKKYASDPLSSTHLERAAIDLHYELQTFLNSSHAFNHAAQKLSQQGLSQHERILWQIFQNAALEGFLLHFRILKQFFNNEKFPSDVKAVHYVPSWQPPAELNVNPDENTRLNQLLSHVSYDRKRLPRSWNITEMEARMCAVFKKFLESLGENCFSFFTDCRLALSVRDRVASS